ncbi:MAG TPA: mechanosensitive ion channel domain-containing protein [Phycisphaerae bacterium]|nr:mechanosensitive ion channel domain-containing protein [Phycisphaerae bacterium]
MSPRSNREHLRRVVQLFLVFAWPFLTPNVSAQDTQPTSAPTTQTQPAAMTQPTPPTVGQLTLEELQLRLKQTQDATDLAEDVKTKAVNLYTQALQQLQMAEQWAIKAAEFEAERQKAPQTLQEIQKELATPLAEPTPGAPPDATRADLEQRLKQLQVDLEAEKKVQADWEKERDRRVVRRKEIPELLTNAKTRLQAPPQPGVAPPDNEQPAAVRLAQQTLSEARDLATKREIQACESELLSYDARRDLLQARLDRAARLVAYLEKLVAAWQNLVQQRARIDSERALREAREQLKHAHPAIRPYAEELEQLALKGKEVTLASSQADERSREIDAQLTKLGDEFERIKKRVNATGLTNAVGQLLRRQRAELPRLSPLERNLRQRKDRIGAVQFAMMELEDRRAELRNTEPLVGQILASLDQTATEDERSAVKEAAEETLNSLKATADTLWKDHDSYFNKLVDLDGKERELVTQIKQFADYVEEKVLWIQSGSVFGMDESRRSAEAFAWLLDPVGWRSVLVSVWGTARASPLKSAVGLLLLIGLLVARPKLRHWLIQSGEPVSKPIKDSIVHTLKALLCTALLATTGPALVWFIAWVIASPFDASDFCRATASGLRGFALILLTTESVRQLARRNGLAERHFKWRGHALRRARRHVSWLILILAPTFFVFSTLDQQETEAWKESLGRIAFIMAFAALGVFGDRLLRPVGGVLGDALRSRQDSQLYRFRYVWYSLAVGVPVVLALAAALGYYYTGLYLGWRLIATVWLLLGLLVLHATIQRWLLVQMRHRAIREARERAAQKRQQLETAQATSADDAGIKIEEPKIGVSDLSKQTNQLVRTAVAIAALAGLWAVWAEALPALGVLKELRPWKTAPITLADLGLALVFVIVTFVAVKNIPGLLEITVLQRLPIDAGGRFAVTAITRYIITVTGVILAFGAVGIGWSKVQWLVAAVSVGLGFGLQEIFANFVSGLVLLFERPIRIGDTVTVGNISGTVTRIRIRATTITDWDRKELVIPNKEFITGQFVNWSLSDSILRVIVSVGIAYGSNTELAEELLHKVAERTEHVMADPKPRVLFMGFGDSSLNFELRVFVPSVDYLLSVRHQLHKAIDQEFRTAGIEIAFPQRDVHVRSIRQALPITREEDKDVGAEGLFEETRPVE